jgi:hypothetical protein
MAAGKFVMDRRALDRPDISWTAKGVLVTIENYGGSATFGQLLESSKTSAKELRRALDELTKAGLLTEGVVS